MHVTELRLGEVLVLHATSDALSGEQRRRAVETLSASDRVRLHSMRDTRADAFLTGRLLVSRGLEHPALDLDLDLGRSSSPTPESVGQDRERGFEATPGRARTGMLEAICSHCGSTGHGKPGIPGLPVLTSITYTGTAVFVALAGAHDLSALGIDAEDQRRDAAPRPAFPSAALPPASQSVGEPAVDLERWTAIEAVLKADGRGLRVDPDEVRFEGEDLARITGQGPSYRIHSAVVDHRFRVAVATRKPDPPGS